jgi:hypothetical protein
MNSKTSYTATFCMLLLLAACDQNNETSTASEPVQQAIPKTEEVIQSDEIVESVEPENAEPGIDENEDMPDNLSDEAGEPDIDTASSQQEAVQSNDSTSIEIDTAVTDTGAATAGNEADSSSTLDESSP